MDLGRTVGQVASVFLIFFGALFVCTLMNHLSVENVGRILSKAFVRQQ